MSNDNGGPVLYILIDGDGHHTVKDEAELNERILDLVMSNDEITFKKSEHGGDGFTRTVLIEVC